MPTLTFISHSGTQHTIDVPTGGSVMQAAVRAGIPGIEAICGGACACATCHIYVDSAWAATLGRATPMEETMLACTTHRQPTSRLACQIRITDALDGFIVHLPHVQG